ncbi:hypothetical protein [Mitsuokella multacida]
MVLVMRKDDRHEKEMVAYDAFGAGFCKLSDALAGSGSGVTG